MNGLGERRFSGTLTDEFDLWRLARPFMGELHEVVRGVVTAFTERRQGLLRALDIGMGDGSITELLLTDDNSP